MTKICNKCNRTMAFDPYFNKYVCRQCGYTENVAPAKHVKNMNADYAACDQFICSDCGIELQDWVKVERDEDNGDETHYEYTFKFCPNCGGKVD